MLPEVFLRQIQYDENMFGLPRRSIAVVFLLINILCWGAALVVVKPALSFATPFEYLALRFWLAAFISLPLLIYYTITQPRLWKSVPKITLLELLGTTITLGLIYEGLARTTALEANIIATTAPLFLILGGVVLFKEREEKHELVGLAIALLGTLLMIFASAHQTWTGIISISIIGNMLVFTQNITESGYFLIGKKFYEKLPKFFVTTISFWVGALTFTPLAYLQQEQSALNFIVELLKLLQQPSVAWAVFYMAVFGSIIGLTAYVTAQNLIEASEASLFRYLQPLVYVPLAVIFLGERLTPPLFIAMMLIGTGVVFSQQHILFPKAKKLRRGKSQRRSLSVTK